MSHLEADVYCRFLLAFHFKMDTIVNTIKYMGALMKFNGNQTPPDFINHYFLFFLWLDLVYSQLRTLCSAQNDCQFPFHFLRSFMSSLL